MSDKSRTKWNARHAAADGDGQQPSAVLTRLAPLLPRSGRALDLAGGRGRHALWLARQGLNVTLCDISDVGCRRAAEAAARTGVALETRQLDLESDSFPRGPWDLILSILYLWRPLFATFGEHLAPGGTLVVIQPTRRNLERHGKPPAQYLLAEGELRELAGELQVVHYEEGWLEDGRHDAVLVARRATETSENFQDGR